MSERLPDFYIIGAMKCATSTLHEQLARREAFFMSEPKEPNFFNDAALYARGMNDYLALFRAARPGQIVGESSTHYTKIPTYENTVDRIFAHTPDARFVYVMRDPIDRLVSHYIHQWTERSVDGPISQAIYDDPQYIAYSSYSRQLEPFVQKFGKERILPVFFEYLVRNKEKELERVARFVGDASMEPFVWQSETAQTNVSKERLRKSKFRETVLSFSMARRIKDALPSDIKERVKSLWRMQKRPELSSAARSHAVAVLDRDLQTLGEWFGLSLTCANFSQVARVTAPTWASSTGVP